MAILTPSEAIYHPPTPVHDWSVGKTTSFAAIIGPIHAGPRWASSNEAFYGVIEPQNDWFFGEIGPF